MGDAECRDVTRAATSTFDFVQPNCGTFFHSVSTKKGHAAQLIVTVLIN
jgi:hypothetical protein